MNEFKDSMGRWLTQSLFFETSQYDQLGVAIYTFGDTDRKYKDKSYVCFKDLYLSCNDPTEYKVATEYLGGWRHWQRLCANKGIMEFIQELRDELEVKLRSEGIRKLRSSADTSPTAAKWLADKGWDKRKAGAPSKEDKARAMKVDDKLADAVAEDAERALQH